MEHPRLIDLDVAHLDGSVTVTLVGELDMGGTEWFREELRPLLPRYDSDQITLDCSRLAFIDGRGLDALAQLARSSGGDGRIALTGCSPLLRKLLAICGQEDLFRLEPTPTAG
jgi:anti-anti-sigma factor